MAFQSSPCTRVSISISILPLWPRPISASLPIYANCGITLAANNCMESSTWRCSSTPAKFMLQITSWMPMACNSLSLATHSSGVPKIYELSNNSSKVRSPCGPRLGDPHLLGPGIMKSDTALGSLPHLAGVFCDIQASTQGKHGPGGIFSSLRPAGSGTGRNILWRAAV